MSFLRLKILLSLTLALIILVTFNGTSLSQSPTPTPTPDNSQAISDLQKKINDLQSKINDLQNQEKSLSSQIAIMDNQIKVTEYRIEATEGEITSLTLDIDTASKKIVNLQNSLNNSIEILLNRIVATYQIGSIQPLQILLTSGNASDFVTRLNYLRLAQAHDKKLIYDTEQAKNDYENQKEIFEQEKKQVEILNKQLQDYTAQLNLQKDDKQRLLAETKGSEANYQKLLAEAQAEFLQIQGIVAGNGTEGEIGQVNKGDTIASIIQGSSCNSSGSHLHFTVSNNGSAQNPFGYLKPVDYSNESNGDDFNASGSWDWPIDPKIYLHQGYGNTWYVRTFGFYSFHNGIDITGASSAVKAVKSGVLFQGYYTGSGGCALRYVRVHQSEDGLDTFYLHVNFVH